MTIKLCLDHKTTPVRTDSYKNEELFLFVVPNCLLQKDTEKLLLLQETITIQITLLQRNKNLPNSNRCQQHLQFNLSWQNMLCRMRKHQKKCNATFYSTLHHINTNRGIHCFIICLECKERSNGFLSVRAPKKSNIKRFV